MISGTRSLMGNRTREHSLSIQKRVKAGIVDGGGGSLFGRWWRKSGEKQLSSCGEFTSKQSSSK